MNESQEWGALGMKCKFIDFESADWNHLDGFEDRTVFQTREWVRFVSESQKAEPVLAELHDGGEIVGYFTGLTFITVWSKGAGKFVSRLDDALHGIQSHQRGVTRLGAAGLGESRSGTTLKCLHMEVSDPNFRFEDGRDLGFQCTAYSSYRTDLTKTEDEIFNSMDSACRRCVRKAEKSGVTIEEAHDLAFADEYYEQLKDVFAKQDLVPTYDVERVRSLIKHLEPTGRVLLVRARDADGKCIASGIFPGYNKIAEFWGNASFRKQPNSAAERIHSMVRHALLEEPGRGGVRLGRRRDVQRKIRMRRPLGAVVYQVAISGRLETS